MAMTIDLSGRAAVVTGGAQGIGEATARGLAAAGAKVLVIDIQEKGAEVAESICQSGAEATFLRGDISSESVIKDAIDRCVDLYGSIDILVNNAHWEVAGAATEISATDWEMSMAVLLRAPFLAAKYAIPFMIRQGGGSIVNIASLRGKKAVPRYVTYTTAKAAIFQLSRQLALDYGPKGIRVNVIVPGEIRSEHVGPANERPRESDIARICPLRCSGIPEDVANAICFLVSDKAAFITGAELYVDGGLDVLSPGTVWERIREILVER